jgi:ATP-dependent RNA helicase DDX56/DBP9
LSLGSLDSLVIDEADLILSYGHDEDIRQIFSGTFLPKVFQSFLMSATMTEDVEMLKGLILRNPVCWPTFLPLRRYFLLESKVALKLEDDDDAAHLSQYSVRFVKSNSLWPLSNQYHEKMFRGRQIPTYLCDPQAQAN